MRVSSSTRVSGAGVLVGILTLATALLLPSPASAADPKAPGDFTGYGFDQCLAPSQRTMNTWLKTSPFLAVGIYIAGDSRGCRNQPNLSASWLDENASKGWRFIPIHVG